MALVKDKNGRQTEEVCATDAQREAYEKWAAKQKEKLLVTENNRAARKKRSPQQQLEMLDKRLGHGVGAKKERAKLCKQTENKT